MRRALLVPCVFSAVLGLPTPAAAADLVHHYQFEGSLADSAFTLNRRSLVYEGSAPACR